MTPESKLTLQYVVYRADAETIRKDITAYELVRLMALSITFTDEALRLLPIDDVALIMANSVAVRPVPSN